MTSSSIYEQTLANMGILPSISAVVVLILIPVIGVSGMGWYSVFGVFIPYAAVLLFIAGFLYRVLRWAGSPVPFRIPTVGGQQKSLPWIKFSSIDSPSTTKGIVARLAVEILLFRSLLKNEKAELQGSQRIFFRASTLLWLAALAFHWSLLVIVFRHLRFFLVPVPSAIIFVQRFDSILQNLLPVIYISDIIFLIGLVYLFFRRIISSQVRYISLPSDYFALLLIAAITISGTLMRLIYRVDLIHVKEWVMAMLSFHPKLPEGVGLLFYIHLFFISLLAAYFPVSKLMHMPGIFLSPTRNLTNNSRERRHINPWNYVVKVHTYQEYEDEFRESMKEVGLTVEKE